MRKILVSLCLLSLAGLAAAPAMAARGGASRLDPQPAPDARSADSGKDCLCHFPPGNTGNSQTLCVGGRAAEAHLRHGDTLGECPDSGREVTCDDSIDNDQDGLTDCQDPDCVGQPGPGQPALRGTRKSSSLWRHDIQFFRDSRRAATVNTRRTAGTAGTVCELPELSCADGYDNDGDGAMDCDDIDCAAAPACDGSEAEVCNDGVDNDEDTLVDCQDPECAGQAGPQGETCEQAEMSCDDGFDNDADLEIDCADMDCAAASVCNGPAEEFCDDGVDNDDDTLVDCQDPECVGQFGPDGEACQQPELSCADAFDNDGDGDIDCDDADCLTNPICDGAGVEICNDGFDNDGDSLVDCQDSECLGQVGQAGEICEQPEVSCDDGLDNDGDASVDCADADCAAVPACDGPAAEICDDLLDNDGDTLVDCRDPECVGQTGGQGETCEQPETTCDDGLDNDADNMIDCDDEDCLQTSVCNGPVMEICDDGIDNDGDGSTDCGDPDCASSPACDPFREFCDDGVDNDFDGDTDCDDSDCIGDPACTAPAVR